MSNSQFPHDQSYWNRLAAEKAQQFEDTGRPHSSVQEEWPNKAIVVGDSSYLDWDGNINLSTEQVLAIFRQRLTSAKYKELGFGSGEIGLGWVMIVEPEVPSDGVDCPGLRELYVGAHQAIYKPASR